MYVCCCMRVVVYVLYTTPWYYSRLVRIVTCGFMNTRCIIFVLIRTGMLRLPFHLLFSPTFFTLAFHPSFHRYTEITKKDGGVVSKPNSVEYFDFDHQVRHAGESHTGGGGRSNY